jgi:hypothetical protein
MLQQKQQKLKNNLKGRDGDWGIRDEYKLCGDS